MTLNQAIAQAQRLVEEAGDPKRAASVVAELARARRTLLGFRLRRADDANARAFETGGEEGGKHARAAQDRVENTIRTVEEALIKAELVTLASKYFTASEWEEARASSATLRIGETREEWSGPACLRAANISLGEAARLLAVVFASSATRHARWTLLNDTLGGTMTTLMAAHPPPSPFAPLLSRFGPAPLGFILAIAFLEITATTMPGEQRETEGASPPLNNMSHNAQIDKLSRAAADTLLSCMSPASWSLACGEDEDKKKQSSIETKHRVLNLLDRLRLYSSAIELYTRESGDLEGHGEAVRTMLKILVRLGRLPAALQLIRRAKDVDGEKRALMSELWELLGHPTGAEEKNMAPRRALMTLLSSQELALLEGLLANPGGRLRPHTVPARVAHLDTLIRLNLLLGRSEAARMRVNELGSLLASLGENDVTTHGRELNFLEAVAKFAQHRSTSSAPLLGSGPLLEGGTGGGAIYYSDADVRAADEAVRREKASWGERRRKHEGGEDEEARAKRYREVLARQRGQLSEAVGGEPDESVGSTVPGSSLAPPPIGVLASPFLSPIPSSSRGDVRPGLVAPTFDMASPQFLQASPPTVTTASASTNPSSTTGVPSSVVSAATSIQPKSKTQLLKAKLSKLSKSER